MEFVKKAFCIFLILFSSFNVFLFAEEEKTAESKTVETSEKKDDSKNEEKIPEYESIIDESNRLHLFSYKDENLEYLTVNNYKSSDKKTVTVYSNNKIIRYFYDSDFYLSKIEKWKSGKTSTDAVLENVILYEYANKIKNSEEASQSAYSKKIIEYNLINKKMTESFFNSDGLIFEKNEFDFTGTEEKALLYKEKYAEKKRISYSYIYKYDDQKRIVLDSVFHYEYKNEITKKVMKKSFRKNTYEYVRVDCPPVTSFYEDDVLRMKTVYTSNTDYIVFVYFDNNAYVQVEYKNSKKYSEIFYVNQEEKVKKIYE